MILNIITHRIITLSITMLGIIVPTTMTLSHDDAIMTFSPMTLRIIQIYTLSYCTQNNNASLLAS